MVGWADTRCSGRWRILHACHAWYVGSIHVDVLPKEPKGGAFGGTGDRPCADRNSGVDESREWPTDGAPTSSSSATAAKGLVRRDHRPGFGAGPSESELLIVVQLGISTRADEEDRIHKHGWESGDGGGSEDDFAEDGAGPTPQQRWEKGRVMWASAKAAKREQEMSAGGMRRMEWRRRRPYERI